MSLGITAIAFGPVIVEGHTRVGEKARDIVGVLAQTQEKIDRRELLDPATLFRLGSGAPWIGPLALSEEGSVLAA